jgi:hypothetical protein
LVSHSRGGRNFSLKHCILTICGAHPVFKPVGRVGTQPSRQSNHWSPYTAKLRKKGAMTPMEGRDSWRAVLPILSFFISLVYLFLYSAVVYHSDKNFFSCNPNIVSINFLQTHISPPSPPLWCPIQDRTAEMYVPWKNIVTTRMGLYLLRH